jgi:hypothetical protein
LKNSQNYKTIWVVIKFETHFQESVKNILLLKTFFGFRVLPGEKKKAVPHPLTSSSLLHIGFGKFKPTTTTTVRNENVSWSSQKYSSPSFWPPLWQG